MGSYARADSHSLKCKRHTPTKFIEPEVYLKKSPVGFSIPISSFIPLDTLPPIQLQLPTDALCNVPHRLMLGLGQALLELSLMPYASRVQKVA
jgi:hypothetical protein